MMDKAKQRKSELKLLRRKAIKLQNASANKVPMAEALKMVKASKAEEG